MPSDKIDFVFEEIIIGRSRPLLIKDKKELQKDLDITAKSIYGNSVCH